MSSASLKVRALRVRAVRVPMAQPHRTASGTVASCPSFSPTSSRTRASKDTVTSSAIPPSR